jgi:nitrilase
VRLAGPDYEDETILVAELERDDIARSRLDFDAVGHYARPDIFRLEVNERPTPAVTGISAATPVETEAPLESSEVRSAVAAVG